MMREMTAEELGLDMETVLRFLRLYDDGKVLESMGKLYGDEQVLKESARRLGEERWRQITEQLFPKKSDNNDD